MLVASDMKERTKISADTSRTFATMSFVSACMIVYLHTGQVGPYDSAWVRLLHEVLNALCRVAIPWFFFAAGFFLARHIGEDGWWKREVLKRIRTLLIPFWFWGAVIWSVHILVAFLIKRIGVVYHGTDAMEWLSWGGIVCVAGLDPHGNVPTMWFIRTLFLFVCLSPLIAKFKRVFVVLSFGAYAVFSALSHKMGEHGVYMLEYLISLRGLLYFSLGLIAFDRGRNIAIGGRCFVIFSGVCLLIGNISYPCCGVFDVLMVPGLLLGVFELCRYIKLPKDLLSMSFPIYVMHATVAFCCSGVYSIVLGSHKTDFLFCTIKFVVVLLISILLARVARSICPNLSKLVYGGR